MPVDNLIIIGGGPAAYTAALYAARAGLHPLCIEGSEAGGQLAGGGSVENFPGFPEAIIGADLVQRCRSQAERFGARFMLRQVTDADLSASPFVLDCNGEERRTRALIVATGASPRTLGIPSETELAGRGVASCGSTVACDADGYIETEPGRSSTSVPGVFAAGDVQDRTYRQAITSAGSGCMAALDAHRWLTGTASESAVAALLRAA